MRSSHNSSRQLLEQGQTKTFWISHTWQRSLQVQGLRQESVHYGTIILHKIGSCAVREVLIVLDKGWTGLLMGNSVTKVCSLAPARCRSSHPIERQTWLGSNVVTKHCKKKPINNQEGDETCLLVQRSSRFLKENKSWTGWACLCCSLGACVLSLVLIQRDFISALELEVCRVPHLGFVDLNWDPLLLLPLREEIRQDTVGRHSPSLFTAALQPEGRKQTSGGSGKEKRGDPENNRATSWPLSSARCLSTPRPPPVIFPPCLPACLPQLHLGADGGDKDECRPWNNKSASAERWPGSHRVLRSQGWVLLRRKDKQPLLGAFKKRLLMLWILTRVRTLV